VTVGVIIVVMNVGIKLKINDPKTLNMYRRRNIIRHLYKENQMLDKIKERASNILEFVTSKKVIIAVGAVAVLITVTSVPKMVTIGAVACAYILAQGYVDSKKK